MTIRNYPPNINLGCGNDLRKDFFNVDIHRFHKPDLVSDVTELKELPSNCFKYALANDILEHIPRHRTLNTLKEWNRILCIDGKLELRVPSAVDIMKLLIHENNNCPSRQEKIIQCLFGTQMYQGDFHYTCFTEILLSDLLARSGFSINYIKIKDSWLFEVSATKSEDSYVDPIFHLDDIEFIKSVFEKFLSRSPDTQAMVHYLETLSSGITKEAIYQQIKDSEEAKNMMKSSKSNP
jgi:predicted SAM-dependent methyltransferase